MAIKTTTLGAFEDSRHNPEYLSIGMTGRLLVAIGPLRVRRARLKPNNSPNNSSAHPSGRTFRTYGSIGLTGSTLAGPSKGQEYLPSFKHDELVPHPHPHLFAAWFARPPSPPPKLMNRFHTPIPSSSPLSSPGHTEIPDSPNSV